MSVLHDLHDSFCQCWKWNVVRYMWKCLMRSFLDSPCKVWVKWSRNHSAALRWLGLDCHGGNLRDKPTVLQRKCVRVYRGGTFLASAEQKDEKSKNWRASEKEVKAGKRQRSLELCLDLFSYPTSKFTFLTSYVLSGIFWSSWLQMLAEIEAQDQGKWLEYNRCNPLMIFWVKAKELWAGALVQRVLTNSM